MREALILFCVDNEFIMLVQGDGGNRLYTFTK